MKTPEEILQALTKCIRGNTDDEMSDERSVDTETTVWRDELGERMFCGEIKHNPTKHQMHLVGIIPGIKSAKDRWIDLVVFLHQSDRAQGNDASWEVCFVWDKTRSPLKRSETTHGGEITKILQPLAELPKLLERELTR